MDKEDERQVRVCIDYIRKWMDKSIDMVGHSEEIQKIACGVKRIEDIIFKNNT